MFVGIKFNVDQILYIFKRLLQIILNLSSKGWYHNDAKPLNYAFKFVENRPNELEMRMIDLGTVTKDTDRYEMKGYTPIYYGLKQDEQK